MEWLLEGGERDQCREQGQAGGTMDMTFPLWSNPPPPVPYPQPVPSYQANDRAKLIIAGSSSNVTHCSARNDEYSLIIPNCLMMCLDHLVLTSCCLKSISDLSHLFQFSMLRLFSRLSCLLAPLPAPAPARCWHRADSGCPPHWLSSHVVRALEHWRSTRSRQARVTQNRAAHKSCTQQARVTR